MTISPLSYGAAGDQPPPDYRRLTDAEYETLENGGSLSPGKYLLDRPLRPKVLPINLGSGVSLRGAPPLAALERTSPAADVLVAAVSGRIVARMDAVAREARDSDSDYVRLWGVHEGLGEAHTMLMQEMRALSS